jgi:uncharacterized protein YegJ (DUF2314 family)
MKLLIVIGVVPILLGVVAFIFLRGRKKSGGIRSIAVFRRSHLPLTEPRVKALVERALGDQPEIMMLPVPPRDDGAQLFAFVRGDLAFGVISVPKPYVDPEAHEQIRATLTDEAILQGMTEHRAWLSVDHMRGSADLAEINSIIARVVAEFVDDDATLLYDVKHHRVAKIDHTTRNVLRGPAPMLVFSADDITVGMRPDDAGLAAAKQKAQQQWPEFLIAWHNRTPDEHFSVKGPFIDGKRVEHMWVTVQEADEQGVRGTLGSEPTQVRNIKEGDPARVSFADMEDWIIADPSRKFRGGFSVGTMLGQQMG